MPTKGDTVPSSACASGPEDLCPIRDELPTTATPKTQTTSAVHCARVNRRRRKMTEKMPTQLWAENRWSAWPTSCVSGTWPHSTSAPRNIW